MSNLFDQQYDENDKEFDVVVFADRFHINVAESMQKMNWSSLVERLSDHRFVPNKELAPDIMPVKMKPREQWKLSFKKDEKDQHYRIDDNVESISVVFLDLDAVGAVDEARRAFKDFDYVLHSTFSYSKEAPHKMRMAVRLDTPLKSYQWREFYNSLGKVVNVDLGCSNMSRLYTLPCLEKGSKVTPFVEINKGRALKLEDMHKLAEIYPRALTIEESKNLENKYGKSRKSQLNPTPYHFSGEQVKRSLLENKKQDLATYQRVHKDKQILLDKHDSRNAFARDVIMAEVANHGFDTDYKNLFKFIYQSSKDYGSRDVFHPKSNTRKELPNLVISLFNTDKHKAFVCENKDELIADAKIKIREAIEEADREFLSGKVTYNTYENEAKAVPFVDFQVDNSIKEIKERNMPAIQSFVSGHRNVLHYAVDIFAQETDKFQEDVNTKSLAEFIIFSTDKVLDQYIARNPDNDNLPNKKEIIGMLDKAANHEGFKFHISPKVPEEKHEMMNDFIKGALKMAHYEYDRGIAFEVPLEPVEKETKSTDLQIEQEAEPSYEM